MFKDIKVKLEFMSPDRKRFSPKELKLIDIEALSRHTMTITIPKYDKDTYTVLREIVANQFKLPMKYIECVDYRYCAKKHEMKNEQVDAYLYIEPLNNDYPSYIRYIPINQSLPLDTNIVIDVDTEKLGLPPNFYYIWSNNMQTDANIEQIIKKENPKSIFTRPWCNCCHIGSIDINSKFYYKGKVSLVNTDVFDSMSLFAFKRNDEKHYFKILTYDCYNVTPVDIIEKMLKQPGISEPTKEFCKEILKQCK